MERSQLPRKGGKGGDEREGKSPGRNEEGGEK